MQRESSYGNLELFYISTCYCFLREQHLNLSVIIQNQGKMEIEIEGTKKIIPQKFAEIKNIGDYIDDMERKRLSKTERRNLEFRLFELKTSEFIESVKQDRLTGPFIKDAKLAGVVRIITKKHSYFVMRFDNRREITVPEKIVSGLDFKTEKRLY